MNSRFIQRDYVIEGVVVDRATRRGVGGAHVEAWDRDTQYHDMLGQVVTDEDGAFTIAFDSEYFGNAAPDRGPDIFYRVFLDGRQVLDTLRQAQHNVGLGVTRVTLEIDLPPLPPTGKDRISAEQAIKVMDWWRASDFRGAVNEGRDKGTTVAKLFGAVLGDSLKNWDFKPVAPKGTREREVINQNQDSARAAFATQGVEVTGVKPVSELGPNADLKSIARYPLRLRQGDRVTLYEDQGKVKYYTRDPAPAQSADTNTVLRIDSDLQAMKVQMQEVDDLRVSIANVRGVSDDAAARAADQATAARASADEVARMRQELEDVRQATARKDAQIARLQHELDEIRTVQDTLASRVSLDRIQALEMAVQRMSPGITIGRAPLSDAAPAGASETPPKAGAKKSAPADKVDAPAKKKAKRPKKNPE